MPETWEEADHLGAAVRASTYAIVTLDKACVIRTWNRGAELIFGYKLGD